MPRRRCAALYFYVSLSPTHHNSQQLIPTLRSNEYFGQYGRISKILLVKRTPSGQPPVVGLYITYHRREDAARCIAAVDGTASPGGGNEVMRASFGTTKYCMAFLRGASCTDHGCMNLHEWGDEKDCFTKEDLSTLYVAMSMFLVLTCDANCSVVKQGNMPSRIQKRRGRTSFWVRSPMIQQVRSPLVLSTISS